MTTTLSRRDFARLLGAGSAAALTGTFADLERAAAAPRITTTLAPDEKYWKGVRDRFVLSKGLAPFNAANLCPSSADVIEAMVTATRSIDRDPSPQNRTQFSEAKEALRRRIAQFLNVSPEEILVMRNTSEANNAVSAGLDLKAGDEVIILADNHPSNHQAWRERARRFGFTVTILEQPNPHPGAQHYVDAITRSLKANTRVVSITHLTSTVGDLLPAAEICRIARERGVLTLVDGAQSFGLLAVDLAVMQPDFYTGSAHKWPCGSRESGVLYVRRDVQPRLWPTIYSPYPGAVGISRTHEGFGQRDEATMIGFDRALALQQTIGREKIEARSRELAQALMAGLARIEGVKVWTTPDPARSAAVVSFQPAALDVRRLSAALYDKDRIVAATRGGSERPGLRMSPHFYNTMEEVERTLGALRRYVRSGV